MVCGSVWENGKEKGNYYSMIGWYKGNLHARSEVLPYIALGALDFGLRVQQHGRLAFLGLRVQVAGCRIDVLDLLSMFGSGTPDECRNVLCLFGIVQGCVL